MPEVLPYPLGLPGPDVIGQIRVLPDGRIRITVGLRSDGNTFIPTQDINLSTYEAARFGDILKDLSIGKGYEWS